MKLLINQSGHLAKRVGVPLLGIALIAGCSSSSASTEGETSVEVEPQSGDVAVTEIDETGALSSHPDAIDIVEDTDADGSTGEVVVVDDASVSDGVTTFPACQSSSTDPDGDGFGYENGRSCLVRAMANDSGSTNGVTTFPACVSDATDPDGDGYGYENGKSCLVGVIADDSADLTNGVTEFPVCVSNATDPDGDGYGYENGKSCLVGVIADDGADSSDGVTAFPACVSSATDPDGDGYGYENGKSCLVGVIADDGAESQPDSVTMFPACTSDATDPDGDGYGYENGKSCLVASTDDTGVSDDDDSVNQAADARFFEGFSQPLPTLSPQDRTTDDATTDIDFGDGFAVVTVESTADERERGRFVPRGRFDSYSAVMSIEPGSVATEDGWVQAHVSSSLYNDTNPPQPDVSSDCFPGDIGIQLIMRLNSDGETYFIFNAYRETAFECGIAEEPGVFDGVNFLVLDNKPELGVSYRLGIAIDREAKLLTFSIDEQVYTYQLLTDVYQPGSSFSSFEARVNRAPGKAIVRYDEISVDGQVYDFTDTDLLGRYSFWDVGDPDTDISYPDGELRLESSWSSNNRGENRMGVTGHDTRYAKAQMRLSSESVAANDGDARLRVGGSMYYASEAPGDRSAINQVFAVTEIRLLESGATDARYCAWRSLDDSFTESVSLVNPDDESGCNTFALTPVLDQTYSVETWMDDANRRIVFAIDGEQHFHDVEGPISTGDELFEMRVQSRATGEGSKAVVYVDNLESVSGAAP